MTPVLIESVLCAALLIVSFYGLGGLFLRGEESSVSASLKIILGFSLFCGLVLIWNFFQPVTYLLPAVTMVIGTALALFRLKPFLREIRERKYALFFTLVVFVLFATWATALAATTVPAADCGLYHVPSMEWAKSHPIVLGLGNLHGRLAFNQCLFSIAGSFDNPYTLIDGRWFTSVMIGSVCVVVFCILSASYLYRESRVGIIGFVASVTSLVWLSFFVVNHNIATPTSDSLNGFLYALIATLGACSLDHRFRETILAPPIRTPFFIALGSLLALLVCFKLSSAIFVASLCLILLIVLIRRAHFKPATSFVLTLAFFGIIFAARGYLLSGYPAYPSTVASIDLPWTVAEAHAKGEMLAVRGWARDPGPNWHTAVERTDWIGSWWERNFKNYKQTFFLPLAVFSSSIPVFLFWFFWEGKKRVSEALIVTAVFQIPIFISILGWLQSAPDPRFTSNIIYGVAVALAGWLTYMISISRTPLAKFVLIGLFAFLGSIFTSNYSSNWFRFPFEREIFVAPTIEFEESFTESGLKIYRPDGGMAWYGPVFSTPYFDENLRMEEYSRWIMLTKKPPTEEDP